MYSKLPTSTSLRLLSLPSAPTEDTITTGQILTLRNFDLEIDCPPYLALSYTWGAPTDVEDESSAYSTDFDVEIYIKAVSCEEEPEQPAENLRIGRNLHEALESIRKLERGKWPLNGTKYIWIDFICIKQSDLEERKQQVQLMGEIYGRAVKVIAWLGQNTMPPASHIFFHRVLMERVEAYRKSHDGSYALKIDTSFEDLSVNCLGLRMNTQKLVDLMKFYHQTKWFYRAWILQEVVLAQDCVALCGNMALELYRLISVARVVENTPGLKVHLEAVAQRHQVTASNFGDRLIKLEALIHSHRHGGLKSKLLSEFLGKVFGAQDDQSMRIAHLEYMITQGMMQGATDPRDKVYAVLGMTDSGHKDTVDPLIVPDYTKSAVEVYITVAELCLTNLPYLSLFSWVWYSRRSGLLDTDGQGLPSWVPDFTVQPAVSSLMHLHSRANFRKQYTSFDAAADENQDDARPIVSGRMLLLSGRYCGTLTQCHSTSEDFVHRARLLAFLLEWCAMLDAPRGDDSTRTQRVHQMISMLTLRTSTPPPDFHHMTPIQAHFHAWTMLNIVQGLTEAGPDSRDLMTTILKATDRLRHTHVVPLPGELMKTIDILEEDQKKPGGEASAKKDRLLRSLIAFNDLSLDTLSRRLIFGTDNDLIGLCPEYARKDDQVWLLQGGKVPFVLRPTGEDNEFELLGECYVAGGMYGELISNGRTGELQDIALI